MYRYWNGMEINGFSMYVLLCKFYCKDFCFLRVFDIYLFCIKLLYLIIYLFRILIKGVWIYVIFKVNDDL